MNTRITPRRLAVFLSSLPPLAWVLQASLILMCLLVLFNASKLSPSMAVLPLALQSLFLPLVAGALAQRAAADIAVWTARRAPQQAARSRQLRMRGDLAILGASGLVLHLLVVAVTAWQETAAFGPLLSIALGGTVLLSVALLIGTGLGLVVERGAPPAAVLAVPLLVWAGDNANSIWQWVSSQAPVLLGLTQLGLLAVFWMGLGSPRLVQQPGFAELRPRHRLDWASLKRLLQPPWQCLPFAAADDKVVLAGWLSPTGDRSHTPKMASLAVLLLVNSLNLINLWSMTQGGVALDGDQSFRLGVWSFVLTVLASAALASDPLHWRRLLAPGGLKRHQLGQRILLQSARQCVLLLGLLAAIALLVHAFAPIAAARTLEGLPLLAIDVALATAWGACVRGWRNSYLAVVGGAFVLTAGVLAGVWVANAMGGTPVRGVEMAAIEMLLTGVLGWQATRMWRHQDLSTLARATASTDLAR